MKNWHHLNIRPGDSRPACGAARRAAVVVLVALVTSGFDEALAQGPRPKPPPPPRAAPSRPKSKAARPTARPTARRAQPGRLAVSTGMSGCTVSIDSLYVGTTDSGGRLDVGGISPGTHLIRIDAPNHHSFDGTFDAVSAATSTVDVELQPLAGYLVVSSSVPDSRVRVGDRPSIETERDIELPPGLHSVEVFRLGYHSLKVDVDIGPGDRRELRATLNPLSVKELTAECERQFNSGLYSAAVELAQLALAQKATKQGAQLLLGASFARLGRFDESYEPLLGALRAGEQILIPVMYSEPKIKANSRRLARGNIVLRDTGIGLVDASGLVQLKFLVPWSKLRECRRTSRGLQLVVAVSDGDRGAVPLTNTLNLLSGAISRPDQRAGERAFQRGPVSKDKPKNETFLLFDTGATVAGGQGEFIIVDNRNCPPTIDLLIRLLDAVKSR